METKEIAFKGLVMNGFLMLLVNFLILVLSIVTIVRFCSAARCFSMVDFPTCLAPITRTAFKKTVCLYKRF